MHHPPHEPSVGAIWGEKHSAWPSSAGLDRCPPAVELLHGDAGLEITLRSLLPPTCDRFIEAGAGFGVGVFRLPIPRGHVAAGFLVALDRLHHVALASKD